MKKTSGFEKFFKGKEKSGAAKKEQIRKDKRQFRKEREEEIAAHKRQKRAQARDGFSSQEAGGQNRQQPSRFGRKDGEQKSRTAFNADKKGRAFTGAGKKDFEQRPNFRKRDEGPKAPGRFQPAKKSPYPEERGNKTPFEKKQSHQPGKKQNRFAENGGGKRTAENRERPQLLKTQTPDAKPRFTAPKAQSEPMPLNKYIAHSGICSRRDAVDLIKGGKVKVNGELILEPGHKVALSDEVKVAGKRLNPVKDFVYILLNKPKDYITTADDPQQRKTVLDLLKNAPPARIYPVGRLDRNTSGVLLLTNDGELSQRLTHPSNEVKKVYAVTLDKPLTKHHFDEILKGVQLEDGPATVDVLAYTDAKDHTQLGVELHSGRNRIVRRLFEHFGYDVKALDRVVFAGLTKKNVNRGKWRFLTEREVRDLKFFKKGRG